MNALSSSLPPSPFTPPSRRSADAALAEAFGTSDVLVPPPPEEGAIPEWHLATGVKPLRPLPQDLTDTVRHRTPPPATAAPPPSATGPRVKRPRRRARTAKLSTRRASKPDGWMLRAGAMLLGAVVVGTVAGALFEHLTRVLRGG
jgi:hypothetical protein